MSGEGTNENVHQEVQDQQGGGLGQGASTEMHGPSFYDLVRDPQERERIRSMIPPEQRAQFDQMVNLAAIGGEDRGTRMGENPDVTETVDEKLKQNLIEASKRIFSGMEDTQREEYASKLFDSYNILTDPTKPDEEREAEIDRFAEQLGQFGFRKGVEEDVDAKVIKATYLNLTEEQFGKIIDRLPEISEEERIERETIADNISEEEAGERDAQTDAMGQVINATGEQVQANIDQEIQKVRQENIPQTEKDRIIEELTARQGKVSSLIEKVKDFFAEDEPGRVWARRAGKTLYWSMMIAFILIIAEMNMINKMASNRRR